ncbi:FAD-dependent oxidoreductase [Microlunatus sp. Y2014]|uniref:FAD-dependent oxidoreductase n=1 Tax=Microlunatus sp. Y2014 TaxID=3418488 RepID=UPI003DA72E8B
MNRADPIPDRPLSELAGDSGPYESIVIGAGQAGLSASHHLQRLGIDHLVLDADQRPGGAWQHRRDDLTMGDVHGVADLPGDPRPPAAPEARANVAVPDYFAAYERHFGLPVLRPARVVRVDRAPAGFSLRVLTPAGERTLVTRTLVSATGTWTRPFIPYYPGIGTFAGRQLHTADYPGADWFVGRRTLVVGGGASAVQFLGQLGPLLGPDDVLWATRRPPVWRTGEFTPEVGSEVVAKVSERVRQGLPPRSVVSVTGLMLREQEQAAADLGIYDARRPMFDRIEPYGVRWDPSTGPGGVVGSGDGGGAYEPVDVILWATGFRPAIEHLAPLGLRSAYGGIRLADDETTVVADPRVQLVGYGPSASTIGGNRAGRRAALGVRRALRSAVAAGPRGGVAATAG